MQLWKAAQVTQFKIFLCVSAGLSHWKNLIIREVVELQGDDITHLESTYSRDERAVSKVQVSSSRSFISLVIMGEAKRPHHYIHHIRKYIFQNYVACTLHINPDECFDTLATS